MGGVEAVVARGDGGGDEGEKAVARSEGDEGDRVGFEGAELESGGWEEALAGVGERAGEERTDLLDDVGEHGGVDKVLLPAAIGDWPRRRRL